ncbi:CPBP family intramembrane glutamic endopeptidase [Kocuria rosea]|uniref:CPBP family intramembrane metalloprotease n=1 Tax=Kocuria rosea TaxID=1275 RepID=A0A4R5YIW9_KOCRO|nr:CPBP family intramembrane glutamic endopeptidase [Kocuria rosea]TDL44379.1 CPBP family intramembrane metalloprotease [Kocuria rosea]
MTSHPPPRPAPWQTGAPSAAARPGGGTSVPRPGGPTTTAPLTHSEFYRTPRNRWWKGLVSILAVSAAILLISVVMSFGAVAIELLRGRMSTEEIASGQIALTPVLLLATNLALIASAAVAVVLHRYLHRQPVGTLHAVEGRFRWGWLGRAAVVVVPLFVAYAAVVALLEAPGPLVLDATALAFLAIVLLTTPLQAAAEEYMFRGVIQRAAGSWVSGAVPSLLLGTLVSAAAFSIAHFASDGWLIAYYFVFGVAMSLLTHFTGGLEAASLVHAANNVVLFLVSTLTGQMGEAVDRSAGVGGPFMLAPMLVIAAVAAVLILLGRRRGLQRRAVPPATA